MYSYVSNTYESAIHIHISCPFGSWCWTGRPGVLWFMGSQRVGYNWATELNWHLHQFSSVQSLSSVWLFVIPWSAACQASLSIINSLSLPKLKSIESNMPSNHLIHCHLLLLMPSIFPSIRAFSNESALRIRWPKCWSFSFSIDRKSTRLNSSHTS